MNKLDIDFVQLMALRQDRSFFQHISEWILFIQTITLRKCNKWGLIEKHRKRKRFGNNWQYFEQFSPYFLTMSLGGCGKTRPRPPGLRRMMEELVDTSSSAIIEGLQRAIVQLGRSHHKDSVGKSLCGKSRTANSLFLSLFKRPLLVKSNHEHHISSRAETLHNVLFVQYDSPVSKILGVFFWNLDSVLL